MKREATIAGLASEGLAMISGSAGQVALFLIGNTNIEFSSLFNPPVSLGPQDEPIKEHNHCCRPLTYHHRLEQPDLDTTAVLLPLSVIKYHT